MMSAVSVDQRYGDSQNSASGRLINLMSQGYKQLLSWTQPVTVMTMTAVRGPEGYFNFEEEVNHYDVFFKKL